MPWAQKPIKSLRRAGAGLYDSFYDSSVKNFALLKLDPNHSSLRFKKVGRYWSARVGLLYRVLAKEQREGLVWFWIGRHAIYDALLRQA